MSCKSFEKMCGTVFVLLEPGEHKCIAVKMFDFQGNEVVRGVHWRTQMLVDNPIINSPFEEPVRCWAYEEGQPVLREGGRPAGYYLTAGKIRAGPSSCD